MNLNAVILITATATTPAIAITIIRIIIERV
jgi:hypothetical protein